LQKKGEKRGITIYDDYGHHPTEVKTTLSGLKQTIGNKRLIVVFQPHRFTRTRDCLDEMPAAFTDADCIVLTDIYHAGEPFLAEGSIEILYERMRMAHAHKLWFFPRSLLIDGLSSILKEDDVVITMGAGDITQVGPELLHALS
jgi:UDP-N-acetylmuramate--alanine ligase